jgi:hypothetical protein
MARQNGGLKYLHDAESSLMMQRNRLYLSNHVTPANGSNSTKVFLTAPEAAAFLRLSPITMSRWRIQGYGPRWIKMGPKRVCYAVDDLKEFTDAQKRTSTSEQ